MFLNSNAVPILYIVAQLAYKLSKSRQLLVLILPRRLFILDKVCQLILHLVESLLRIQSKTKTIWESMEKPVGSLSVIISQECNGALFAEAKHLPLNGYDIFSFRTVLLVKANTYT